MLDNYRDLIDELLGTPAALRRLAAERGEPLPATATRLIAELRDRDRAVLKRLQTMTREPHPYLRALGPVEPAVPDDDAALLAEFDTARGDLVSLLMNLTLRDWERTAIHEVDGEITLAEEVERHVEFDEDHLERIRRSFAGEGAAGA